MDKQPEALRLAEWLDYWQQPTAKEAAAELRRLNAVEVEANLLIEREWQRNKVLSDRIAALESQITYLRSQLAPDHDK